MPAPQMVQHSKFQVSHVMFDNGDFAIAWGTWEDGSQCLGMRWNGDDDDPGYPKLFGHPVWLMIPGDLTRPILGGLVAANQAGTNVEAVLEVLGEIQ